jgi:hypothetical protein
VLQCNIHSVQVQYFLYCKSRNIQPRQSSSTIPVCYHVEVFNAWECVYVHFCVLLCIRYSTGTRFLPIIFSYVLHSFHCFPFVFIILNLILNLILVLLVLIQTDIYSCKSVIRSSSVWTNCRTSLARTRPV